MKTFLRTLLVGMALVLFGEEASAQVFKTRMDMPCGVWTQRRDEQGKGGDRLAAGIAQSWLVGYLSGVATALGKDFWGDTTTMEPTYLWMDNYCRANPSKFIGVAALELFREKTKGK